MSSQGIAVECRDVSVRRQGKDILERISFALEPGSLTLLFGPNGGGKSTLLKVLVGLEKAESGELLIDKKPLELARNLVGYVPQRVIAQPHIPLSVSHAVLMGLTALRGPFQRWNNEDHRRVSIALDEVELGGRELDDIRSLSGGELQRVYIARALVREPRLLLLDEATSGIDVGVKSSILSLVERLKERMTILFVTHDMSVVSEAVDEVLCLQRTLVAHGRPSEALSAEAMAVMYGSDAQPFMHCHLPHRHVHSGGCG
jgi:zinc transport system ATP-binding protein